MRVVGLIGAVLVVVTLAILSSALGQENSSRRQPRPSSDSDRVGVSLDAVSILQDQQKRYAASVDFPSVGLILRVPKAPEPNAPRKFALQCTGTLIAPTFLLTAAHCICNPEPDRFIEALGVCQSKKAERPFYWDPAHYKAFFQHSGTYNVTSLRIHEGYDRGFADLALLELDRPVSEIRTAELELFPTTSNLPADYNSIVVGFGFNHLDEDNQRGGIKFHAAGRAFTCDLSDLPYTDRSSICSLWSPPATSEEGASIAGTICGGDSGGPMFSYSKAAPRRFRLIGVASRGDRVCQGTTYHVRVGKQQFMKWIRDHVPSLAAAAPLAPTTALDPVFNDDATVRGDAKGLYTFSSAVAEEGKPLCATFHVLASSFAAVSVSVNAGSGAEDVSLEVLKDASPELCAPDRRGKDEAKRVCADVARPGTGNVAWCSMPLQANEIWQLRIYASPGTQIQYTITNHQ